MTTPLEHARAQREASLQRLVDFLRIPSVSAVAAHAEDVEAAAGWLADRMRDVGVQGVRVDPTPGHPVVFGRVDVDPNAPTVLVYGHYDVQPPDPLELWHSPPFEPTIRDGKLYARGACDDKGQLLTHVEAADACASTTGLPVNLRYVFEGEEEVGSPNLGPWLSAHRAELDADVAVISDTAIVGPGQPSIVYGLRGLAYFEIELQGPRRDLHSGQFGGAVLNPATALAHVLASLQDREGRVLIDGFYDDVRPLSAEERAELAQVPLDASAFREATGEAGGWGEPGYSLVERIGARPSLDVNGLVSGWTGEGAKTVLPARATAKLSMRLVPDQDPDRVEAQLRAHLEAVAPAGARLELRSLHGARPAICDREHPAMRAASRAYGAVFGSAPVFTREGGSIPVVNDLAEQLGLQTVLMGFGLPDDNLHAPDEKLDVVQYERGVETVIAFLHELAASEAAP